MKKIDNLFIKLAAHGLFIGLVTFSIAAFCQPKIQKKSLRAPAALQIDGGTGEWPDNRLQAFNTVDNIWYTICNDDNNIYLTVRGQRGPFYDAMHKIERGGVTFTICHSTANTGTLKTSDNIAITFPVRDDNLKNSSNLSILNSMIGVDGSKFRGSRDTASIKRRRDSSINELNTLIANIFKQIKVTGIKNIKDTLISVENNTGIRAMGRFNAAMDLVVEMAVPLNYLGLSLNGDKKLNYNIKLTGPPQIKPNPFTIKDVRPDGNIISYTAPMKKVPAKKASKYNPQFEYSFTPTDFWGKYTLAKKP